MPFCNNYSILLQFFFSISIFWSGSLLLIWGSCFSKSVEYSCCTFTILSFNTPYTSPCWLVGLKSTPLAVMSLARALSLPYNFMGERKCIFARACQVNVIQFCRDAFSLSLHGDQFFLQLGVFSRWELIQPALSESIPFGQSFQLPYSWHLSIAARILPAPESLAPFRWYSDLSAPQKILKIPYRLF
jgi:hypothetical protein